MTFLTTTADSTASERISDPVSSKGPSFLQRIWPPAFLAFTLVLTVAWWVFLGYGLIKLIS
jgi:polyferredoxin